MVLLLLLLYTPTPAKSSPSFIWGKHCDWAEDDCFFKYLHLSGSFWIRFPYTRGWLLKYFFLKSPCDSHLYDPLEDTLKESIEKLHVNFGKLKKNTKNRFLEVMDVGDNRLSSPLLFMNGINSEDLVWPFGTSQHTQAREPPREVVVKRKVWLR